MDPDAHERDTPRRNVYEEAVKRTKERMANSKKGRADDIRAILATPQAFKQCLLQHQPGDIVGDIVNPDDTNLCGCVLE
jgi:hypothetical protein